jgi:chromosome segregation ATPase
VLLLTQEIEYRKRLRFMEDKEKALEQLSGRVTESQKNYFNNEIEGSFSEKIASLIESYKVRVKDNQFNVETNKAAIQQALNVIVKNMETIELNARNYVQDIKSDIEVRVNALEEDCTELNNVKEENESLKSELDNASNQMEVLNSILLESKKEFDENLASANIKYSKLKEEDDKLHQDHMKLRVEFGDMKESLTDKNIALTTELNKLKEEHNQELSKLKEDHATELAKLNKEAVEKINAVASDYTELKIKTDATISKLDKDLAVANSVIESKNDLIKRLEEEISSEKRHLENVIGPMAVYYSRRNKELESLLKTNGISFEPNNFQNGGREDIIEQRRKDKSINKDEDK